MVNSVFGFLISLQCLTDITLSAVTTLGPKCPLAGQRNLGLLTDGKDEYVQRLVANNDTKQDILDVLNERRLQESFTACSPLFVWDDELAMSAQEWADQCALVEYESSVPAKLYHDQWLRRTRTIRDRPFAKEPGVAQTIHWARTKQGLGKEEVAELLDSNISIEEGLIDGLFTSFGENDEGNILSWGHATHVGCGWIQFPGRSGYENFMVCNYGIGIPQNNSCSDVKDSDPPYVTYYRAPYDVIKDVKKCLKAVRCRRRNKGLKGRDPCSTDVENCLKAKSGLEFIKPSRLRGVARSNDDIMVDLEASKCKIDTILCSLNGTLACKDRLRKCLPLFDLDNQDQVKTECECAELTLSDGTVGDCTSLGPNQPPFCFVKQAPCIAVDEFGQIEESEPYIPSNGLLHTSNSACF